MNEEGRTSAKNELRRLHFRHLPFTLFVDGGLQVIPHQQTSDGVVVGERFLLSLVHFAAKLFLFFVVLQGIHQLCHQILQKRFSFGVLTTGIEALRGTDEGVDHRTCNHRPLQSSVEGKILTERRKSGKGVSHCGVAHQRSRFFVIAGPRFLHHLLLLNTSEKVSVFLHQRVGPAYRDGHFPCLVRFFVRRFVSLIFHFRCASLKAFYSILMLFLSSLAVLDLPIAFHGFLYSRVSLQVLILAFQQGVSNFLDFLL